MVEAEPVNVTFTADTSDLVSGINEGGRAMSNFSETAKVADFSIRQVSGSSIGMFRAMIDMRVALMSVENVMKRFGVTNKEVADIMGTVTTIMDIAIAVMAIYRAAKVATGLASWFAAKAGFAEAAAEESVATGGFGMPVAVAEGASAIGTFEG